MSKLEDTDFTGKVSGFRDPTQLPLDEEEARVWQEANRNWWESAPMRYDWREEIAAAVGTREYFDEIDRRFFGAVAKYMPWRERPFDNLIDFSALARQDVLEIGVGHGSHAQLIAPHCRSYTGIDLTQTAVDMTSVRLQQRGITACIQRMDAERMDFPDRSFDLIWSWGVIHHSSDTSRILREMRRVLRPGGKAVVMVYHRSTWKYYVMDGFFKGVLQGGLFRQKSLVTVNQAATDGAIARYYTLGEWRRLCAGMLPVEAIKVVGQKLDLIPLPAGALKDAVERTIPDPVARFFTNRLCFGSFLIARMTNPEVAP